MNRIKFSELNQPEKSSVLFSTLRYLEAKSETLSEIEGKTEVKQTSRFDEITYFLIILLGWRWNCKQKSRTPCEIPGLAPGVQLNVFGTTGADPGPIY